MMLSVLLSISATCVFVVSSAQFMPGGGPGFTFSHSPPMGLPPIIPGMPSGGIPGMGSMSMFPMGNLPNLPNMPLSKLPMVVMPYHNSKQEQVHQPAPPKYMYMKKSRKHGKHRRHHDLDSDSSSSSYESSRSRKNHKNLVLTPVVSYLTKDGYVVYQKKISPKTAKDWLDVGKKMEDYEDSESNEKDQRRRRKTRKQKILVILQMTLLLAVSQAYFMEEEVTTEPSTTKMFWPFVPGYYSMVPKDIKPVFFYGKKK